MGIMKDFKSFAMRGNVVDLAVAVVIGGAFGKIIASFVNDVLMPPIGLLLGGADFSNLKVVLKAGSEAILNGDAVVTPAVAEVAIKYGSFVNTVVDFTIVAFAIFMVIKAIEKTKKKEAAKPAAPPAPSKEEVLLSEIRDILKEKQ
ncbi:large-conductance mechanosensitive channel protein MscL [uncultured Draconibacterium sp.]|uniref:large-conductance mechanosensitive channel protein MscL n=1 Tax=uncultured Draconibacterium sp. TaxID=1573823 RepID=UPI003216CCE2